MQNSFTPLTNLMIYKGIIIKISFLFLISVSPLQLEVYLVNWVAIHEGSLNEYCSFYINTF